MAEKATSSIIVNGNIEDIYEAWANFPSFPEFMDNIKSVEVTGPKTTHWIAEGPMNMTFEWDAVTTEMTPNRRIAWQSTGGDIETSGDVTFSIISEDETEVTVTMTYGHKTGAIADKVAKLFDNPEDRVAQDLRNFKQYVESVYNPLPRY